MQIFYFEFFQEQLQKFYKKFSIVLNDKNLYHHKQNKNRFENSDIYKKKKS